MSTPTMSDAVSRWDPAPVRFGERDWLDGRTVALIGTACLLAIVLALLSATFLTGATSFTLSRHIALYALVALAQALCLAVRGMNLSLGALGSVCTVLLGLLLDPAFAGMPTMLGVVAVLAAGLAAGLVQGVLIVRLRIDAFIVSLSLMFVFLGLRSGISGGSAYRLPEGFTWLGQSGMLGAIPWLLVLALAVLALAALVLGRTVPGRQFLATGSNPDAARLAGIATDRMIVSAHAVSGLVAAVAAISWASWSGNAAPQTGDDWLIASFAVAIIGGTSLAGGGIPVAGLLAGAAVFTLIKHALVVARINDQYSSTVLGALILLAIVGDRLRERLLGTGWRH